MLQWWDNGFVLDALFDEENTSSLEEGFVQRDFRRAARQLLDDHPLEHALWLSRTDSMELEKEARLHASFIRHGIASWGASVAAADLVRIRQELVRVLSHDALVTEKSRERAKEFIKKNLIELLGVRCFMDTSERFQLGVATPFWHPKYKLERGEQELDLLRARKKDPLDHGFIPIDQETWRGRMFHELCFWLMSQGALTPTTRYACLHALTREEREKGDLEQTHAVFEGDLRIPLNQVLLDLRHYTRVPSLLFALPQQSYSLYAFSLAIEKDALDVLKVSSDGRSARSPLVQSSEAGLKGTGEQFELVFRNDRTGSRQSKYPSLVTLPVDPVAGGARAPILEQLVRGMENLNIPKELFEHVPRVCAGFFTAAQQDLLLDWEMDPRTFWDTEAGTRICKLVGFNPSNYKHRKRVQDVRDLLGKIRIFQGERENGELKTIYHDVLLEPRSAVLETIPGHHPDFDGHHTFHAYTINPILWNMTRVGSERTRFMVIDPIAFELDDSSSRAFNLYWVLVNRAYMSRHGSRRVDHVGKFSIKLETLLFFAGGTPEDRRVARIRPNLVRDLNLMLDQGLLRDWSCDALEKKRISRKNFMEADLEVIFGARQLDCFNYNDDPTQVPILPSNGHS